MVIKRRIIRINNSLSQQVQKHFRVIGQITNHRLSVFLYNGGGGDEFLFTFFLVVHGDEILEVGTPYCTQDLCVIFWVMASPQLYFSLSVLAYYFLKKCSNNILPQMSPSTMRSSGKTQMKNRISSIIFKQVRY